MAAPHISDTKESLMSPTPHARTAPEKTVLLCGASGFIGRVLAQQLTERGYHVVKASRHSEPALQYADLQTTASWLPHLRGIDIVINAVGSLRDQPGAQGAPLAALHSRAPQALFDACAELGIRRIMQLSALGSDGSDTAYAHTKNEADVHLLALTEQGLLEGAVIRPSLVLGAQGASTALFMNLAKLPIVVLPEAMHRFQIQPVWVQELAQAMLNILESTAVGVFEMGGPERLSMAQLVASLRQQAGKAPALSFKLPAALATLSARMGDWVRTSPWSSEALKLSAMDNCCDPAVMQHWLGRVPTSPLHILAAMDAWQANPHTASAHGA